jgi:rhodanese-related sulfurtransferase
MGNNFDPMKLASITASELSARLAAESGLTLIDVRTPAEFAELHAAPGHADASAPVYVLCQSGKRAESACARLSSAGFAKAVVVTGGTEAWAAAGLPVVRGQGSAIGIERQVRIGAGALVVLGVVLAQTVHANFVWLSAFVGAGLVFAGVTGFCGMGLLLAKAPWNRA